MGQLAPQAEDHQAVLRPVHPRDRRARLRAARRRRRRAGLHRGVPLALVLHTHMPYVEGHGTWPFGEEWLWEAMATSYLPLLDVLDRAPELTLSVTPVLGDQLEAPGVDRKSTRLNSSHANISYAVFCLKKK